VLTLLWLLGQLPLRLPALRFLGRRHSSSGGASWSRGWQHGTPDGGGSEQLPRLLLSLVVLSLAGGTAERQLGASLCWLSGGSSSISWASWLGHSARSSSPLCGSTAAAAAFVLAFTSACAAAHAVTVWLRWRQARDSARAQPHSFGVWQTAQHSTQHGIELLLLALLAREWWHSFAALAGAAMGSTPAGGAATLVQAAGLAFSLLPRPLALHAAEMAASAAQPWVLWWRGGGSRDPSAVLLAAGYVVAQQLLLRQRQRAAPVAAAQAWLSLASRGSCASPNALSRRQPLQLRRSLLTAALIGLLRFLADAALLPALPALRAVQHWRTAALATSASRLLSCAAAVAAAQTLLLLASRASLGTLQSGPSFAAAQLLLCSLGALLLLRSASLGQAATVHVHAS
jgi:hypothetical protein